MASLQAALKNAIQVHYQLEDSELAAEPLPDARRPPADPFYEAAEGGAGVLRQLVDDPDALAAVARRPCELCHFDPTPATTSGARPAPEEDCEAACYDCLMSYGNQPDHQLLDRQVIRELLLKLSQASASAPAGLPGPSTCERCKALCDSDLEHDWLDFLEEHNLRLPDKAQNR